MIEVNVNSYITIEEADSYFSSRLGADFWAELEESTKEKALITATKKIDRLTFIGWKKSLKQPLQFPRVYYSGFCYNGLQIADVPQAIKDAVCEEALTTLQYIENNSEEVYNGAVDGNYQSIKLGDASITYGSSGVSGGSSMDGTTRNLLSNEAKELLSGLLKVGFDIANQRFYEEF